MTSYICCLGLLLFSNLLRVSEVFILRQRQHQLTWQAELKDREGGPRVHSCTHHSAVHLDPWPHRSVSQPPSALCFLPLSSPLVLTWTGRRYTKGPVCHQNQGSPKASGGQRAEAVPGRGWPHRWCQLPVATPVEMHRDRDKGGEGPSLVGTSFWEWWHFLCVTPDRPRPEFCSGLGQGVWRQWRYPVPDGSWKDCQCHVYNKDGQTAALSNVPNDLLKLLFKLEMEIPNCGGMLWRHTSRVCIALIPKDL